MPKEACSEEYTDSFNVLLMLSLTAQAGDPVAQMTFRVTDDFGNVVTGAPVTASTFLRWVPGSEFGRDEYDQAKGVTDTNGAGRPQVAEQDR